MRLTLLGAVSITLPIYPLLGETTGRSDSAAVFDPVEKQVEQILAAMTLEQKVSLCHGASSFSIAAIPSVGIPEEFVFSDGPHNVRGEVARDAPFDIVTDKDYSTSLPPLTALAATWDVALARRHGEVIGEEARDRGKDCMLGPGMNIMRTPLNGRNFEYLGEDPLLAGKMAAAYIRGMQSRDVAACAKHFALNDQELNRKGVDVEADERTIREIYLRPFETAVREGGVMTVMNGYNKFRGEFCSENGYLNNRVLKKEWGFRGFVVTDWGSLHDTVAGALGGTDVEMSFGKNIRFFKQPLIEAVKSGAVPLSVVDDKARRVLRVMALTGKLDGRKRFAGSRNTPEHREAARTIAESAIVLLKNDAGVLPLDPAALKKVLVVGENAIREHCRSGGSAKGKPLYEVTPLKALRERFGAAPEITYAPFPAAGDALRPIPSDCLLTTDPNAGVKAWKTEFFRGVSPQGEPVATVYQAAVGVPARKEPIKGIGPDHYSVRWSAEIVAPESGEYEIGFTCDDGARLFIDDKAVLSDWKSGAKRFAATRIRMESGRHYRLRLEYFQGTGEAFAGLGWAPPSEGAGKRLQELAASAAKYDAVLVFTGTNHDLEQEGGDRRDLKLPAGEDDAVRALLAANPRTVVVNLSGAPVEMPWIAKAPTLVQYWFSGQEGGNALARVLCGDVNPSGRLPFTFPVKLEDSPAHALGEYGPLKVTYNEGVFVGYRWFDSRNIEPLFPFGFGLSYTAFAFGTPVAEAAAGGAVSIRVPVTNRGRREGSEVVQLYVHDDEPSLPRPPNELKAFEKLRLAPGETAEATLTVSARDLAYWSVKDMGWKVRPGRYDVRIGDSSRNLPLHVALDYDGATLKPAAR